MQMNHDDLVFTYGMYASVEWIWSILHGRAEIRNFSSSVEKYFTNERSERVKYLFEHEKRFFVSPSGQVINALFII